MRRRTLIQRSVFGIVATGLFPAARVLAAAEPPLVEPVASERSDGTVRGRYAVLPFDTADFGQTFGQGWWGGARPQLVNSVADLLTGELAKAGFDVVERSRIKDILAEQALASSGSIDPDTAVRTGKLLGARYLVVGTIADWGMRERGISGLRIADPLRAGRQTQIGVGVAIARAVLEFRVVDAETGRIVTADRAEGSESRANLSFDSGWYRSLNFRDSEWWSSQIGRATRKAATTVPARILGTRADEAFVLEMLDDDQFVIEVDPRRRPRKGDGYDVMRTLRVVRNASGRVVYRKTEPVASAKVVEVQEAGAVLRITRALKGESVHPGLAVVRH
ncbi:MAG: CsgG/HfaB family protein [Armatimonadota bacterium]